MSRRSPFILHLPFVLPHDAFYPHPVTPPPLNRSQSGFKVRTEAREASSQ